MLHADHGNLDQVPNLCKTLFAYPQMGRTPARPTSWLSLKEKMYGKGLWDPEAEQIWSVITFVQTQPVCSGTSCAVGRKF